MRQVSNADYDALVRSLRQVARLAYVAAGNNKDKNMAGKLARIGKKLYDKECRQSDSHRPGR